MSGCQHGAISIQFDILLQTIQIISSLCLVLLAVDMLRILESKMSKNTTNTTKKAVFDQLQITILSNTIHFFIILERYS